MMRLEKLCSDDGSLKDSINGEFVFLGIDFNSRTAHSQDQIKINSAIYNRKNLKRKKFIWFRYFDFKRKIETSIVATLYKVRLMGHDYNLDIKNL